MPENNDKQFKLRGIFNLGICKTSCLELEENEEGVFTEVEYQRQSISNHARDLVRSAYTTISSYHGQSKHHGIDYRIRKELGVTRRI